MSYSVRGTLIRVERKKKKNRERKKKVLGKTGIFAGDITIETGGEPPVPLSLTLDSPADGTVTNQNTIMVSGSVTGEEPLTVTVSGATVALTDDDFSTTVNLSEGSNSIDVVAADGSNQTAEESVTVTLDTVSPQLSLDPSSGSTLASTIPIFTLTYTDPSPGTGLDTATLEVFLDGQDVTAQVQVQPDQATFQPAAPLGDGSHSIVSRARDVAGNTGETSSTFSIDSVAPFLTSNIASGSTISTSTPTLVATYADPDPGSGVDVSSFQAFLDGNSITSSFTVGSLQSSFQIPRGSGLSDASHSLEYRIADNVSHQNVVTVNLVVDTQGPLVSIDEPRDGVELQTSVPTIQISYSDAGSGVNPASLVIALDGENRTADFVIGAATAVFQVPSTEPLAGGPHSLVVNVTDVREEAFPPAKRPPRRGSFLKGSSPNRRPVPA